MGICCLSGLDLVPSVPILSPIQRHGSRAKQQNKVENLARFSDPKSVRQLTTIYQQSTTTSPQKTTLKTRIFSKTPCKNAPPPRNKKNLEN
jgi:hypothetical protein